MEIPTLVMILVPIGTFIIGMKMKEEVTELWDALKNLFTK